MKSRAFTLIELLVVVLIIGILTAIALPQYEKSVEKTKAAQAFVLLRSVYQAAAAYYMANGTYPQTFDDMGFEIPWTGNKQWNPVASIKDTKSNEDWSLQLVHASAGGSLVIYLGRLSGKYTGGGFVMTVENSTGELRKGEIRCAEHINAKFAEGAYCVQLMHGTRDTASTAVSFKAYNLP